MTNVFVTNGHSRATLQIVRSLGSHGITVYVGDEYSVTPTRFSRYINSYVKYPSPSLNPVGFVDYINDFCRRHDIKIIMPVVDDCLIALSKYRKRLDDDILLPIASHQSILLARDKMKTIELCKEVGIPYPETILQESPDISELRNRMDLPILIKPRESSGSRGIKVIHHWSDFNETFDKVKKGFGVPMIQQYIPHGGAYGVEVLYDKGKQVMKFTHKRLREYPDGGGPSTLRISTSMNEIETYAKKLMDKLQWHGVAMVEFRVHSETNVPYIMEINPRYWGSLRLSIVSGMDFPYYHYLMASGSDIKPPEQYKTDIMARWLLFGDILWFLTTHDPNRLKNFFKTFLYNNLYYDIISRDDPLPVFGSFLEGLGIYMDNKRRKQAVERGLE